MEIFCYKDIQADSIDDLLKLISDKVSEVMGYSRDSIYELLRERESLSPTAIGRGVLLPHTRLDSITTHYILIFMLRGEIPYTTPDGSPIRLVFCIISPSDSKTEYLRLVANIVRILKEDTLYNQIFMAEDEQALKGLIADMLRSRGVES
jgi:PTS system nitrogen regulatory IIA component